LKNIQGRNLAVGLQVDKHIEYLHLRFERPRHVVIAERLIRKGLQPRHLDLSDAETDEGASAITAFLCLDQHQQLLRQAKHLSLDCKLPREALHVSHHLHPLHCASLLC
jgi:hypothetical protein